MVATCPFKFGGPVFEGDFVDRSDPMQIVVERILQGQSTAITGAPHTGKSSLLFHLAASERRFSFFGEERYCCTLPSPLDSHTFGHRFTQSQFWHQALIPLKENWVDPDLSSPLARRYQTCEVNDFGTWTLERLFEQLFKQKKQLVILLDEFDVLLNSSALHNAEFYGSLRSLASTKRGALSLIIASRKSLERLDEATHEFVSEGGSPYFNYFEEVVLGDFPAEDIVKLLERGRERIPPNDQTFICHLAGRHPYLLQVTATAMWKTYKESEEHVRHHRTVAKSVYRQLARHFKETWDNWTPNTRLAITIIGLANIYNLIADHKNRMAQLRRTLSSLSKEVDALEATGLLERDSQDVRSWRITQALMLWWLADELKRVSQDESSFNQWISERLGEHLTLGQQRELNDAIDDLSVGGIELVEKFVHAREMAKEHPNRSHPLTGVQSRLMGLFRHRTR